LRADDSTVGFYCVTITWPQIFKGSLLLMVVAVDVFPHVSVELELRYSCR